MGWLNHLSLRGTMTERRVIYVGKKPLHAYVRAVVMAMEEGDRSVQLVARGATISRAVDVAEVCRRRSGHIAQGLPETVTIEHLSCESEEIPGEDGIRTVSVLRIDLDGEGDVPPAQDA
jgi:DNA-binding protein